jgi:hypothetical protein
MPRWSLFSVGHLTGPTMPASSGGSLPPTPKFLGLSTKLGLPNGGVVTSMSKLPPHSTFRPHTTVIVFLRHEVKSKVIFIYIIHSSSCTYKSWREVAMLQLELWTLITNLLLVGSPPISVVDLRAPSSTSILYTLMMDCTCRSSQPMDWHISINVWSIVLMN